jgi:hypothetical protein
MPATFKLPTPSEAAFAVPETLRVPTPSEAAFAVPETFRVAVLIWPLTPSEAALRVAVLVDETLIVEANKNGIVKVSKLKIVLVELEVKPAVLISVAERLLTVAFETFIEAMLAIPVTLRLATPSEAAFAVPETFRLTVLI